MKNFCFVLLSLTSILTGCKESSNNQESLREGDTGIEGNQHSYAPGQEEVLEERETIVLEEGQELLRKIQGEYMELGNNAEGYFYQEPCGYSMHAVSVHEIYEGTGIWEIGWAEDSYYIESATEEGGDIHIKTNSNIEEEFWFLANDQDMVWNFGSGRKEVQEIVLREDITNMPMIPCSDKEEIMKHLPSSWYLLDEVHGKSVIIQPCEEAPAGIDITSNAEFLDFRSGSDPNEIVSMFKLNSVVSIIHRSVYGGEPDTLVIHDKYSDVARIGNGSADDRRYVSEAGKDIYEVLEEPCD